MIFIVLFVSKEIVTNFISIFWDLLRSFLVNILSITRDIFSLFVGVLNFIFNLINCDLILVNIVLDIINLSINLFLDNINSFIDLLLDLIKIPALNIDVIIPVNFTQVIALECLFQGPKTSSFHLVILVRFLSLLNLASSFEVMVEFKQRANSNKSNDNKTFLSISMDFTYILSLRSFVTHSWF